MSWHGKPFLGRLPAYPSSSSMQGLRSLRRHPFESLVAGQDAPIELGRRILGHFGIRGVSAWHAAAHEDTLPTASQPLPEYDQEREILHCAARLTPGYFLRVKGLYFPAGATAVLSGTWDFDQVVGSIEATATFYDVDGGSETVTRSFSFQPSPFRMSSNDNPGGEPNTTSATWAGLIPFSFDLEPAGIRHAITNTLIRRWTRVGTRVEVTIKAVGGARIMCGVVQELGHRIGWQVDESGDSDEIPPQHGLHPDSWSVIEWPAEAFSDTLSSGGDRTFPLGGSYMAHTVNEAMAQDLGTHVIGWSSWDESSDLSTDDPYRVPWNTTSTTVVRIPDGSSDAWSEDGPGFAIGSLGYARKWGVGGPGYWKTRSNSRCRVKVYAKLAASETSGTVRVQSGKASWVDVAVTGTSYAWHDNWGYLKHPISPEGTGLAQIFGWCGNGNGLDVLAVAVYRDDHAG